MSYSIVNFQQTDKIFFAKYYYQEQLIIGSKLKYPTYGTFLYRSHHFAHNYNVFQKNEDNAKLLSTKSLST